MQREIKLRAWDKSEKRFLSQEEMTEIGGFYYDRGVDPGEDFYLVQYTGMKDKNGKEIWEGDIVYLDGYGNYEVVFPFTQLYESYPENDIGEIIGNIYEETRTVKDEFAHLIGCTTHVDKVNGYLVIDSKSRVLNNRHDYDKYAVYDIGKVVGMMGTDRLIVSYGKNTDCVYHKKYTKVI